MIYWTVEDTNAGSTADQHEDDPAIGVATREATHGPTIKALRVCSMEEGRICLEEAQLIEQGYMIDTDALASALAQISFFQGMSQIARDAVRAVALLMVEVKLDGTEKVIPEGIVDCVVDRLMDMVKTATQAAVAEIKAASTVLTESSTQMAATATSYQDALTSKGPMPTPNPVVVAATLDVRVRARAGVKSRKILIDAHSCGECILQGVSMTGLVDLANATLRDMEHVSDHHFISSCQLGNGGMLLEMNSEAVASWLSAPATWAPFLGHFAPDATVREHAFSLVVQFVPLYFKLEKDPEIHQVEEDNGLPAGLLLHAHWIKPAYQRAHDQTCGHVILIASAADVANNILTNSLLICQKRVYAKKCKKEPTCCLKCQGWDHLSYEVYDTCGTYAGQHRTLSCSPGS